MSGMSLDDENVPFTPRPRAVRRRSPSLIDVRLDPAQRRVVDLPVGRALLVLGEAGHGKTTVALHRLAHLWRRASARPRAAVVVPTDGLARLLQPLLRRLGVDLEVLTYDRWASRHARRAFRGLPRESDSTPPSVMRLKRHPALRGALAELAPRQPGRIDDDRDAPAARRARSVSRGDLQHLFGDGPLLEKVARDGSIGPRSVVDTLDRTRVQFNLTAEEEWAHVTDRARLVTVDGRPMDEGTAAGHANTVDVEDYAVLSELDALRAERARRPLAVKPTYDLLMIDEAQEMAPLELALLGRTLKADGTLIVAGDAQQQIDETADFAGWPAVMRELGRARHETVELAIGYRCPPGVVSLARAVLRPQAPRVDATPVHTFDADSALAHWLALGLGSLQRRDARASVGILCRSPLTARKLTADLQRRELPVRLVFDGRFSSRGVQVTTVEEVKGLEFDFVVIPDADGSSYPDDERARRSLYVAITRARHQVVVACVGRRSPLVRVLP
jgi:superfamily I DNA/RNA helicase